MSVVAGFMIFNPYSTLKTIEADLHYLQRNNLVVTLAKSLRIFNGVPMQEILENQGRLKHHSPFKTYHEYRVPTKVAGLYYLLKELHVQIEDQIRETAQDKIWQIKARGGNFNQRISWQNLTQLTWQMESNLLQAGIDFYREERKRTLIKQAIHQLYTGPLGAQLDMLKEAKLLETGEVMNETQFANQVIAVLSKPPRNTLHEEYVWNKM